MSAEIVPFVSQTRKARIAEINRLVTAEVNRRPKWKGFIEGTSIIPQNKFDEWEDYLRDCAASVAQRLWDEGRLHLAVIAQNYLKKG